MYLKFYRIDIKGKNTEQFLTDRLLNNESVIYYVTN